MRFLRIEILPETGVIDYQQLKRSQMDLLAEWQNAIRHEQIKYIANPTTTFSAYTFFDYPDQKYLKAVIKSAYTNRDGDLYWAGTKYDDFDLLYKKLSEQKFIAELVVEEEL